MNAAGRIHFYHQAPFFPLFHVELINYGTHKSHKWLIMDSCLICFLSVPRLTRDLLSAQFLLDPGTVSVTNLFSFPGTVNKAN